MPSARWAIAGSDPAAVKRLTQELGIRPVTARVLVARGSADTASARRFLRPAIGDLSDPFLFAGMREAVERLRGR